MVYVNQGKIGKIVGLSYTAIVLYPPTDSLLSCSYKSPLRPAIDDVQDNDEIHSMMMLKKTITSLIHNLLLHLTLH
jgi:hypothetical protein